MAKTYRMNRGDLVFVILFFLLIGFIGGTLLAPQSIVQQALEPVSVDGEKTVEISIPAVAEDGVGVVGKVITTIRPGTGKTNVNVDNIISFPSFQQSAKEARAAAEVYMKKDLSNIDIDVDVQVNASVIEGPSAGASMAASIVLAMENIPAAKEIMMTGGILGNTTVTKVGAIEEKARAAKDAGAEIFLVPGGQGSEDSSVRTRTCTRTNGVLRCRVTYDQSPVSIGPSLNITVKEVNTLADIIEVYNEQNAGTASS